MRTEKKRPKVFSFNPGAAENQETGDLRADEQLLSWMDRQTFSKIYFCLPLNVFIHIIFFNSQVSATIGL